MDNIHLIDDRRRTVIIKIFVSVPVLEYFQDPAVQEKVKEVGRVIYSNDSITVNLGAIIAAGALALLGETEH